MSKETEARLLDIIEWFIGKTQAEAALSQSNVETGFSQPPIREVLPDGVSSRSMEPEEVTDARWAHDSGIISTEELEAELRRAANQSSVFELDDGVT